MTEYLYAAYDNGKLIGEKTSREWEDDLSVPRQAIRDYARSGVAYRDRYIFRMAGDKSEEQTERITAQDLETFKRSLKIGAKFTHLSHHKDFVKGSRVVVEKVTVVQKFPHIVKLAGVDNPKHEVAMTYMELLRQKRARAKKRMLTAGR
ncbi:MAG: hypothetical protein LBQ71_14260 [Hungatella sp.]|jgi:hypothetical protein|nr:hypothetical protein [Hungatella sp.]